MAGSSIRIDNVDWLQGLQELDEASIDLAFADPPFNIGYHLPSARDDRLRGRLQHGFKTYA